jgi:hypothetical protein
MNKTIIASLVLALSISSVNAGWHETFDTPATPGAMLTFTSDMTWAWWGFGSCEVADGHVTLVGGLDPFQNNTSWIQIDQTEGFSNSDANAVITPDSATIYLKVKFTTTGTPTDNDQIHVAVATDPSFLTNTNVYTVVSSPVGIIGDFYFGTGATAGTPHPAIVYDSWFWEKIVVNGDSVSIWAFADGEAPADTATWTYTTDNVAVGAGAPTLIIVGVTDDDSSAVHIDEFWYNERPTGMSISDDAPIASSYELGQNYPNPFNPTTHIRFNIPETAGAKLTVFNIMGEAVANLVDGVVSAGGHTVSWNAANMPTGVYFYRLESGNFTQTRKLLLVK